VELVGDLLHQGLRLVGGVLGVLRHGSLGAGKGVGAGGGGSGAVNAAGRRPAVVGFYKVRWGLGLIGGLGDVEFGMDGGERPTEIQGGRPGAFATGQ
jgi:hypothetical protein